MLLFRYVKVWRSRYYLLKLGLLLYGLSMAKTCVEKCRISITTVTILYNRRRNHHLLNLSVWLFLGSGGPALCCCILDNVILERGFVNVWQNYRQLVFPSPIKMFMTHLSYFRIGSRFHKVIKGFVVQVVGIDPSQLARINRFLCQSFGIYRKNNLSQTWFLTRVKEFFRGLLDILASEYVTECLVWKLQI